MQVGCPHCGGALQVAQQTAGQMVMCPYCRQKLQMPHLDPSTPQIPMATPAPPHSAQTPTIQQVVVNTPAPRATNTMGVISVCCAVLGMFTCGLTCIPGFALAILGLSQPDNGSAIVGLIFNGIVAVPMMILFLTGTMASMLWWL